MVFHSRLDFRSLRRHRSKDHVKTNLDSPTLPKTPAVELRQSLIDAMENMPDNTLRHSQSVGDVHPHREDVVSGFFNLQSQQPPTNLIRLETTVQRLFSEGKQNCSNGLIHEKRYCLLRRFTLETVLIVLKTISQSYFSSKDIQMRQ